MHAPKFLPLILATVSCAPAPTDFTEVQRDEAAAEVREVSLALVDALNTHQADSILAFYSLDDEFTQLACTSFVVGGTGFANLTRALHAGYPDAVYEMSVQDVRVLGPAAAVVSLQGTMLAPLFVTRVLRKADDGRWLVAWEHESWPGCPTPPAPHPGTASGDSALAAALPDIP